MFIHSPLERGEPVINWVVYLCYIFGRVDIEQMSNAHVVRYVIFKKNVSNSNPSILHVSLYFIRRGETRIQSCPTLDQASVERPHHP